jgi:hypothetical protein
MPAARTIVSNVIALAMVLLAGTGLWLFLMTPPSDLDLARSKSSARGMFVVAITPEAEPVPQGSLHAWVLTLNTSDGKAVADARIQIGGGMPDHNHGLPTSPQVTDYLGGGRYRVEGVKFTMSGWWELRFAIAAAAGADDVVFNLVL